MHDTTRDAHGTNAARTTRVPDVLGLEVTAGHARPAAFKGAVLGVGPHRLPSGRNY